MNIVKACLQNLAVSLVVFSGLAGSPEVAGQTHYYEVGMNREDSPPTEWRDSSFIVAASSPALVAQCDSQLALNVSLRQSVFGRPTLGNGGFNHNGSYWFHWCFPVDSFSFSDASIEICNGRPYSDVDLNLSYWVTSVKCYQSNPLVLKREVSAPTAITGHLSARADQAIVVCQSRNGFRLAIPQAYGQATMEICNATGRTISPATIIKQSTYIDLSKLPEGLYFARIASGAQKATVRLMKAW
jgi:Secretion system C-terminal sorting domain